MEIQDYYAKPDVTIREHASMLLCEMERLKACGYIADEKLYALIKIACLHHDDGKVNREFQNRIKTGKTFNPEKEIPHNVLSAYLLNPEEFESDEDYYRVLCAIAYHHDYGELTQIIRDREKNVLVQELLKDFPVYKMTKRKVCEMQEMICDKTTVKIKGFLHKCDYSASGNYISEYPNDFLESSLENVKNKWKKSNPESDWNELQKFCREKQDENIIVVAQTGMGKTEAGLWWIGNRKGYFVLPLRAAINAIYDRVKEEILLKKKLDERLSVLHSESLEYYLKQPQEEYTAEEYERRGKRFSIPLNISTMDQLFDFVFKYQGYELKLTTFSYSRIVIDEIQMYDPELLRYLICGLKMITQMGGKIAIMTATLSPFVKELLMKEIQFKEENIKTFLDDTLRHHIQTREYKINAEEIAELYLKNKKMKKGNKILVVCNTIRNAQMIYQSLKDILEDTSELYILHSRFTRGERAEKEKEIIKFGRTYDERGELDIQNSVWVSTSLVEASLDIDFDYLFTELQDLNSLFQRLGRCNRKGRKDTSEANCFVYTVIDPGLLTKSQNGFIDAVIFELSKRAIEEGNGLLTEHRKIELINKYMTTENVRNSDYYERYKAASWIDQIAPYQYERNENTLRNIVSEQVIPSPVFEQEKQRIEDISKKLADPEAGKTEKIRLKEALMDFSVNIPYYQWIQYQKAKKAGLAESFPIIRFGKKQEIPVIECIYNELGYQPMDYKNVIRSPEFL